MHCLNSLTTAPLGTELVKSPTSASVCGFNDIVIDRALIGFERQRIIVLLLKDLPGRSMFITKVMRANGRSVQIDPYKSGPTNRALQIGQVLFVQLSARFTLASVWIGQAVSCPVWPFRLAPMRPFPAELTRKKYIHLEQETYIGNKLINHI